MRIGHGYDVHRLVSERKLILGGVEITHKLGLLGHSDADVLLHAICDAILGALAAGDIGQHFPDSDEQFKGISSLELLKKVVDLADEEGWVVGNLDSTLVAQQPKIAPHLPQMVKNIAQCCGVLVSQVNVKATTTELLGFAGRQEGIAAHAVVILTAKISGLPIQNERKVVVAL